MLFGVVVKVFLTGFHFYPVCTDFFFLFKQLDFFTFPSPLPACTLGQTLLLRTLGDQQCLLDNHDDILMETTVTIVGCWATGEGFT